MKKPSATIDTTSTGFSGLVGWCAEPRNFQHLREALTE